MVFLKKLKLICIYKNRNGYTRSGERILSKILLEQPAGINQSSSSAPVYS